MSDDLGLLLSHFDTDEPFLEEGIPLDSAAQNPKPEEGAHPDEYDYEGGDQSSLSAQRWGIVAPEGEVGDRLLALVAPLQKRREEQMGIGRGRAWIRRVKPVMTEQDADDWIARVWKDEDVPKHDRPRYLLLLGDADVVPWELQKKLMAGAYAGRLAFSTGAGYEAYVAKVLASEREKAADGARALFYCVRGDPATEEGYHGLLRPAFAAAQEAQPSGTFPAKEIVELGEGAGVPLDDFLRAARERRPTMMFTVSHGAGAPRTGWRSLDAKRSFQGAMCFGGGEKITPDLVSKGPFLPGGVWFFFACFGAGTPASSSYDVFLEQLKEIGNFKGSIADLHKALPKEGEKPFVARLPEAALANPDGPLAVIGHVDLAWTYGFQDYGDKGKQNRTSRFTDVLRSLVDGKRAGLGLYALQSTLHSTSVALSTIYNQEERAKKKGLPVDDDKAKKAKKANLWMLHEDLSAYVLLGDPAAHLNIAQATAAHVPIDEPAAVAASSAPTAQRASKIKKLDDIEKMERAIWKVLNEDTDAKKAAGKLDVDEDDVEAWVTAYRNGGLEALKKL